MKSGHTSKRFKNGDVEVTFNSGFITVLKTDEMLEMCYNIIDDENHPIKQQKSISNIYQILTEFLIIKIARDHADYDFRQQ